MASSSQPSRIATTGDLERRDSSSRRATRRAASSIRRPRTGSRSCSRSGSPGEPAKTILIDGFVDRTGKIPGMVARRRVRMDPPRLANTCSDVTIPTGGCQRMPSCAPHDPRPPSTIAASLMSSSNSTRGTASSRSSRSTRGRSGSSATSQGRARPAVDDLPRRERHAGSGTGAVPGRSLRDVRDPRRDGHRPRLEPPPSPGWTRHPDRG